MSRRIIEKVAVGWEDIEPAITAFVAAELPFVFQGVHGNAKTTVGKLIGLVYGDGTFRYFDCSKANLIGMAGFPDAEAMKNGEQAFIPNNKSLIGSDKFPVAVILLDELTRAPKEAQNLLLEVVENKSVFGIPTGHRICIATMNPESYKAAMKLDDALVDRFIAYVPVPDYKEFTAAQIEQAIKVNMAQETNEEYFYEVGADFKVVVEQVRAKYNELIRDPLLQDRVSAYCGQLYEISKARFAVDAEPPYVSGREQFAQLWRAIIALASYYNVMYKRDLRESLVDAAQEALKYCVVTKHTLNENHVKILNMAHRQSKSILMAGGDGPAAKLQIAYAKSLAPQAKLMFLEQYYDDIVKHCDPVLQNEMLQTTLDDINEYLPPQAEARRRIESDKLQMRARLFAICKRSKDFAPTADILEGALLCQLVQGMNTHGYNTNREPYKSALSRPTIKASDIVDLIVALSDKGI